jgi:hypothetical protein
MLHGFSTYLGRDDGHLIVQLAVLIDRDSSLAVGQRMLVELGSSRLPSKFAQFLPQDFLVVDIDVLISEEHYAALGNYHPIS